MSNELTKGIIAGDDFIAETILYGLINNGIESPDDYYVVDDIKRHNYWRTKHKVKPIAEPLDFVSDAAVIILAFKPEDTDRILAKISSKTRKEAVIVSVVRKLKIKEIENYLPNNRIIRLVINPSIISGAGLGAYVVGSQDKTTTEEMAQTVLSDLGTFIEVGSENELEKVRDFILANTFLSYIVTRAMIDTGKNLGFTTEHAGIVADQILKGASRTLVELQDEGSVMFRDGLKNTKVINEAIHLIKEYGIYDSIERALTKKDASKIFTPYRDDDETEMFNMHYNWFDSMVNQ